MDLTYFDNAATSFPKPPRVYDAVNEYLRNNGASPGRSAHRHAVAADRLVFDTRELVGKLFSIRDSSRIIFTQNTTEALNLALFGILKRGDRVAVSGLEHNAVMRPLRALEKQRGISVEVIPCSPQGDFDIALWESCLQSGIKMAIVNHGSNIIGSIAPIGALGERCRKYHALLCVDAAQTAGACEIDVDAMNIDLLAFAGHKALYGTQGTGGLFIREGIVCEPLIYGGTGSNSESDEQPMFLPDYYESGTRNGPGIAALAAGVAFVLDTGVKTIYDHGVKLMQQLRCGLDKIPRIRQYVPTASDHLLPTISLAFDSIDHARVAQRLDEEFGMAVRIGLHCAPLAHRTIGTFPVGTLRISFGYFNTEHEVDALIDALRSIAR